MKYFSLIILSFLNLYSSLGFARPFVSIPEGMQKETTLLLQFPETNAILNKLQANGPLNLRWIPLGNRGFNAFWSQDQRLIGLNGSISWTTGKKLFSLLFEMHNAMADDQLAALDRLALRKEISKNDYVIAVEEIEYQNVIKTSQLLKRGVNLGYFPRDIEIPVYPNLKEHLQLQRNCGHSKVISQMYDDLTHLR